MAMLTGTKLGIWWLRVARVCGKACDVTPVLLILGPHVVDIAILVTTQELPAFLPAPAVFTLVPVAAPITIITAAATMTVA